MSTSGMADWGSHSILLWCCHQACGGSGGAHPDTRLRTHRSLCFVAKHRKLYAQEKASQEERRQQGDTAQQDSQPPQGDQQEHEHAQQQWAGEEPGKQQQQAKAPALVVPSSNVVQHTDVEVRLV
jgi:hypothetical protein